MLIPIIILALAAIAAMFLRYVIGFVCGRITRDIGPFTPVRIAMILTVLACVCVFYYSLGQFVAGIGS